MVHSFQQDGVLAEPGRRADGSPAEPLATLTARATQTMLDVHGFRIKMIEKPFHVTTRDDPAILEIVKGLTRSRTLSCACLKCHDYSGPCAIYFSSGPSIKMNDSSPH